MINKVILVGRLTREPELRKTPNGASVCSFTLAVSRVKGKNSPANAPDADFIPCVAWNQTAELLCNYMHKGSQVGIEGRIQTRNYDDPNTPNKKVYVTEVYVENVTFLESKSASESNRQNNNYNNNYNSNYNNNSYYPDDNYGESTNTAPTMNIASDDLPF